VHTLFGPFLPHNPSNPSSFQAEPVLPFSPILLKRRQNIFKKCESMILYTAKQSLESVEKNQDKSFSHKQKLREFVINYPDS
jgi:hypothetical protein